MALAGALLPLLPTTPFVLLAAYFFSKGRPDWHVRLRESRAFGAAVRDWESRGAISPRGKALATAAMAAVAAWLWAFGPAPYGVKFAATALEAAVLVFIWTRPS